MLSGALDAQGKQQLAGHADGQHGMKQVVWRQDAALDQPVRLMAHQSVPVFGCLAGKLRVNDGMTHGVLAILIDPRVQRREIVVEDLLVRLGLTVSSHGFGPSAEEGVAGIQGRHQI